LCIAYRIYPKISKTPIVFSEDKYKLSEFCLKSFVESLRGINYKMIVLLDGCPESYYELFVNNIPSDRLVIHKYTGIGNLPTFEKQIELLLEQEYSEYVYFAEDDYFYLPNQFKSLLDFIKLNNVHFLTPYDHLDYYKHALHNHKKRVVLGEDRHWMQISTTCLTFLTTKTVLKQTYKTLKIYCKGSSETAVWMLLTKEAIFNPFLIVKRVIQNKYVLVFFLQMIRYGFLKIFWGKKYNLFCPIPSIATHMESKFIAPVVDWGFEKYSKK